MNAFFPDSNPIKAAHGHSLRLGQKMIVEYAQGLSTAKRVLDGERCTMYRRTIKRVGGINKVTIKKVDWYLLPSDTVITRFGIDIIVDTEIYAATHINHPSIKWVRDYGSNYNWIWRCAKELCRMFTQDRGKKHLTEAVLDTLGSSHAPVNIKVGNFTKPPVVAGARTEHFQQLSEKTSVQHAYQQYLLEKYAEFQSRKKPIEVRFINTPEWAL